MNSVLELVRARVFNPATRFDEGVLVPAPPTFPPATAHVVEATEQVLGFSLADFLRELYLSVGNGGFGPGYGVMGIIGGCPDDLRNTVVDLSALHWFRSIRSGVALA